MLIFIKMKTIKEIFDNMNERQIRMLDRMFGLYRIVYPAGIITAVHTLSSGPVPPILDGMLFGLGAVLTTDGLGDVITGKHHYLGVKLLNHISERRNIKYLL